MAEIRTRFAPSPTGYLHLGNVRTAIFNWLYARKNGGKFILRIEDTDLQRSKKEYEEAIVKDLQWLGIDWDEFYRQSDRFEIYREYAKKLVEEGKAFYCTCTQEEIRQRNLERGIDSFQYDGKCRGRREEPKGTPYVIRFFSGDPPFVEYNDLVKGKIVVPGDQIDDFIIIKSDGTPTYNFAVVIDDILMGITHIIRGEDHITNTAKQLLVYKALNATPPSFAHLPLILNKDKTTLSKREGSTSISYYRKEGFIPEAIINYLARLGWSYGDQELFTVEELKKLFDIDGINKSNAVFDDQKMLWVNQMQMRMLPVEKLLYYLNIFKTETNIDKETGIDIFSAPTSWLQKAIPILVPRNKTLKELYIDISIYLVERPHIPEEFAQEIFSRDIVEALGYTAEVIDKEFSEQNFPEEKLVDILKNIAKERNIDFRKFAQGIRLALTGKKVSPDLLQVMELLGKQKVIQRLKYVEAKYL